MKDLLKRKVKLNDDGESAEKLIKRKLNHVYFYEDVDVNTILSLKENLQEANNALSKMIEEFGDVVHQEIVLHICSPGGCVISGLNAIDIIKKNKYPVKTVVEGIAASAATLLSLAGYKREIQEHSVMLFHRIRGWMIGTHTEIEDEMYNWNIYEEIILNFYQSKSNLTKTKLKKLVADEKITSAKEALEFNFVDKII